MGSTRDKGAGVSGKRGAPCKRAAIGRPSSAVEFAPDHESLEKPSLSNRSMAQGAMRSPLAGVLLGKTSLNSLYGLKGGHPRTATRSQFIDTAPFATSDSAERIKLLFCLSVTPAHGHPASWFRGGGI
jgi:hypothetical protein